MQAKDLGLSSNVQWDRKHEHWELPQIITQSNAVIETKGVICSAWRCWGKLCSTDMGKHSARDEMGFPGNKGQKEMSKRTAMCKDMARGSICHVCLERLL